MDELTLHEVSVIRANAGEGYGPVTVRMLCDLIASQSAELTAKQRIIDAQAGMIAEMQEKLRAETTELRMQMLSDQGQHIKETGRLRDQIAVMIDPAKMMRWTSTETGDTLNFGPFAAGLVRCVKYSKVEWTGQVLVKPWIPSTFPTEVEARAAVERAVLEALGVMP